MENQKRRSIRFLALIVFCAAFLAGNFFMPEKVAEAATKKASISATKMTIPIGKMNSKTYWNVNPGELGNAKQLTVKNQIKGAVYSFTSSNTKVVKINKNGGYLTGIKAGTATITCSQTYKNKKTTVGTCKVTVKSAVLKSFDDVYDDAYAVGNNGYNLISYYACVDPLYYIGYRNPKATYTLTSDSKDFSIKEVKYDASNAKDVTNDKDYQEVIEDYIGKGYFYGYQYEAKKAGTYKITIKETYNKKTKTLGSFKVEIKDTCISEPKQELPLGDYLNALALLKYSKESTSYYFNIEEFDETNIENNALLCYFEESVNSLYFYANKAGTVNVTIREGSETGKEIGTVAVTVYEVPCESITLESDEVTAYVDDYFEINYDLEPYHTTDEVTIESDNPEVLKVVCEDGYWNYMPLKVGEANVTIKCGSHSAVCKVVVAEY